MWFIYSFYKHSQDTISISKSLITTHFKLLALSFTHLGCSPYYRRRSALRSGSLAAVVGGCSRLVILKRLPHVPGTFAALAAGGHGRPGVLVQLSEPQTTQWTHTRSDGTLSK